MQKILEITKHIIIFTVLLAVTTGFAVTISFAFYKTFRDFEFLSSFNINEDEFITLFYNNAIVSYVIIYIFSGIILKNKRLTNFSKFGLIFTCFILLYLILTAGVLLII